MLHVYSTYPPIRTRRDSLGVDAARIEHTLEFVLSGELDLSNAPALQGEFTRALDNIVRNQGRPARMILDLRSLTFIDSTGIQALVATKRRCTRYGVRMSLRVGDSQVSRVLALAGVAEFLGAEPSFD